MSNLLIIGASSGVGLALAETLSDSHDLWTASRHRDGDDPRHASWDAARQPFPPDFLPDRLDGMVYCPGNIRLKPFEHLGVKAFNEDFNLNLLGAVRAIEAALPALNYADHASIVLFSTVAVATGMPMHASIAAAKGAVEGLTRSLAAEFAPRIRVNAIAPSLTDTPLAAGLLRTDRQRLLAAERHPLKRVGHATDIAAAARFLLSDESAWMTGHIMALDGGMGTVRQFS